MLAEAARMDLLSTLQAVHVTVKAGNSSLLIEHSVSTSVEKHIFHLMSLKNAIPALTAVKVVPQIQFALSVIFPMSLIRLLSSAYVQELLFFFTLESASRFPILVKTKL